MFMGNAYYVVYGVHRSERIAYMCNAYNFSFVGEQLLVSIHVEFA